jgi:precorrin-2 methylase
MRTVSVVGIGAGNPEHITVQAIVMIRRPPLADAASCESPGDAVSWLLRQPRLG